MADTTDKKPEQRPRKGPMEKLQELVEDFVQGLQEMLNPPRPVRVPVSPGGRRR